MLSAAELRDKALRLLTRREHSRLELERKLSRHPGTADDAGTGEKIAAVLDELEQAGLLSDSRFAAAYVSERLAKGFGPLRIRAELQQRGIAKHLIDTVLALDESSCHDALCRADRQHGGAANLGASPTERRRATAKRARFLESRGFPAHLIARVLNQDDAFSP